MSRITQNIFKTDFLIVILTFTFTFVVFQQLTFAQDKELVEMQALGDTLFKTMSIDELKLIHPIN